MNAPGLQGPSGEGRDPDLVWNAYNAPSGDADLREIVALLRRRWKLIAGIATIAVLVALVAALRTPPQYRAEAVIRLQDERGALTSGLPGAAVEEVIGKSEDPLLSQLQILRSRRVAAAVVDTLGLRLRPEAATVARSSLSGVSIDDPKLADTLEVRFGAAAYIVTRNGRSARAAYGERVEVDGVRFSIAGRPRVPQARFFVDPLQAVERWVIGGVAAHPRENTDVVDVRFTSTDPALAANVVNALVDEFRAQNATGERQQARMRRIFIEEQLAATDSMLLDLQSALTRFREHNQLFSSRDMLATQQSGLMALQVRREELAVDRQIFQSLLAQLDESDSDTGRALRTLVSSPGIAANPVIGTLYGQLVRYESSLDSMTAGEWSSAPTNPDVQRLRSLVESTRDRLRDAVNSHIAALDARIAALDDLRRRNASDLAALPPTEANEARLVQQLESVRAVADQLRVEYQRARMAEAVEVGQVEIVDRATVPSVPVGTGRRQKVMLGLVLGLMLGVGAAFLRERLAYVVTGKDDLERLLNVPAIAVIPQIGRDSRKKRMLRGLSSSRASTNGGPPTLIALNDRNSGPAEAYRTLRTNLIFSRAVRDFHRVVITSSSPGEGKTTTAANLAITFAQQGMQVLLLDCDLRRPQIHAAFGIPREPGLTARLIGRASTEQVVRSTSVDGLFVIPCGAIPPNPSELLGGGPMEALLDELGAAYDIVVLDTPPLLGASDAAVLGTQADAVLLVVRAGETERGAAEAAMGQLRNVGARVIGAVLNDPDGAVPRYGGHYYYAYYESRP